MKIGLLLGSFDPPHIGHLYNAHYALNQGMDQVWVTPAWVNPAKSNQTPYDNRFEMCKLIFNTDNRIIVSDFDKYAQSHYTYQGLEKLLLAKPDNDYYIIGGTDVIDSMKRWRKSEWILQHFNAIETPRIGITDKDVALGIKCSSSEIRNLLKEGKSVLPFINSELLQYITKNNLYK